MDEVLIAMGKDFADVLKDEEQDDRIFYVIEFLEALDSRLTAIQGMKLLTAIQEEIAFRIEEGEWMQ